MDKEFFGIDLADALRRASERLGVPIEALRHRPLPVPSSQPLKQARVGILVETEGLAVKPAPQTLDWNARVEQLRDRPAECAGYVLERLLEGLGFAASVVASDRGEHTLLQVKFTAEAPDTRRGEFRELRGALQYLLNRVLGEGRDTERRIVVDFGGDLEDRTSRMTALAEEMARKVGVLGKAIRIGLMDPQDRRLLHTALVDHPGVTTFSQGEGRFRALCIRPRS